MSNQAFPDALSTPDTETSRGVVGDKLPSQISPSKAALAREKLEKPSGLCRVFNPPKLEKKHSSGDLISRLKTRKILGVGETDNGDIHRSKISQVLGHNEHLYVRLPRGFWVTHVCLGIEVTLEAVLLLFTPTFASALGLLPPTAIEENHPTQAIRIAGAALLGFTVFVWSLLGTTDKHYARTVLMAVLTYHAISAVLSAGTAIFRGDTTEHWVRASVGARTVLCLVCLGYFHRIGEPGSGFRKSSSYRDISKDEAKDTNSKISPDFNAETEDKKDK